MRAFASIGRGRSRKPFWKHDAFWFVGVPTSFVALLFLIAVVVRAAGA